MKWHGAGIVEVFIYNAFLNITTISQKATNKV